MTGDPRESRAHRQAEIHQLPWVRRPRRSLREVLAGPDWRILLLSLIFAPLKIVQLASLLWGGSSASSVDWLVLILTFVPWAVLVAWLCRPTSYESRDI